MLERIWPLAAFVMLAGCGVAGPDYRPPAHSVASSAPALGLFHSAAGPAIDAARPLPDHWWRLYHDPQLDTLVEQALAANTDLRVADANLARAQAVLQEAEAGRLLSTGLSGGTTLTRPSGSDAPLPGTLGANFGISAAYPLDLNGRIRRAIEASSADVEASIAARDYVRTTVAAATARAYGQVCAANYLLAVNRRVVALQRQTLVATQRLARGGRGTAFDVSRAQSAVDTSEASLPALMGQRQSALYLLATLLGRAPADYPAQVADCPTLPVLSQPLPTGDGAALIRRRPDIRAAERAIAADTARIGVATADLYPQVSLGGSLGLSGPLDSIASGSSFGFSLGPLVSWTFPNRPIARARIAGAEAQVQGDLARFDGTVIEALRQTETALETYRRDHDRAAALAKASKSAALSASQADRLFRFGRGDFLDLLDAERSYATAEVASANARVAMLDDQIAVFLALGGGWEGDPSSGG